MATRETSGTTIEPGFVSRVASGLRYAISGVTPTSWFGPSQPLAPAAQEQTEGRQFDYPVGYNLRIQPRSEEAIGFAALRGLADGYDLMRLAIETRKDQLEAFEWELVPADADATEGKYKEQIKAATAMLERPDRESDWPEWLRMMAEDLLVIDTVCVYPRKTKGGKLYSLDLVDGSTIKRLIDEDGRTPMAPSPAYQQVLKGIPAADYTVDDLYYLMRNKRTWKLYGYSPVEQVIMTVNIALRRQISQLQFYTEGNIPEAIAQLPKDWPASSVKEFQGWWDSLMEGNTANRRKMKFIPNLEGILFPKAGVIKDEYDEWLARVVCYAFNISPTAFVKQQNRATAEQAADTAKEEGLIPLLRWFEVNLSRLVQGPMGFPELKFKWKMANKVAPKDQADIDVKYVGLKVLTPDEVRESLGKPPLSAEEKEAAWPTPVEPVIPPSNGDPAAKETEGLAPPNAAGKPPVEKLTKGSEDQPRDEMGRWTATGSENGFDVFQGTEKLGSVRLTTFFQDKKSAGQTFATSRKEVKRYMFSPSQALLAKNPYSDAHGIKTLREMEEHISRVARLPGNFPKVKKYDTSDELVKAKRKVTGVGKYVKRRQPAVARQIKKVLHAAAKQVAAKVAKLYAAKLQKTDWNEEDHPRDEQGRWTADGGGIVYHGTSSDNAASIREVGFKTGIGVGMSGTSANVFTFVTPVRAGAKYYGEANFRNKQSEVMTARLSGRVMELSGKMPDYRAYGEVRDRLGLPTDARGTYDEAKIAQALADKGYVGFSFKDSLAGGRTALAVIPSALRVKKLVKGDADIIQAILDDLALEGVSVQMVEAITPAMIRAFKVAGIRGVLQVKMSAADDITKQLDEAALTYAEKRSAKLVTGLDKTTREELRSVLAKGVEEGWSTDELSTHIEEMGAFGEARANVIARTELANAHVQGNVEGWKASGEEVLKRSILGDLHDHEDECDECADAGVVAMDDDFIPGLKFPPYHPNCICDIAPVLTPLKGDT